MEQTYLLRRSNGGLTNTAVGCCIESKGKRKESAAALRCLDSCARQKTKCRQPLASGAMRERSSLYLAILRRGLSWPSRSTFSVLRNRASRVGGRAISSRADCSPLPRSTTVGVLGPRCKQCDRPAARMTIGCIGSAVHRIIYGFDIAGFTSALRSITEV
jgi:hypothetical protein